MAVLLKQPEPRSCYLAGPMRGYEDWNFPLFRRAARYLREKGWEVFSPAERDEQDPNHPTIEEWKEAEASFSTAPLSFAEYMSHDLPMVCKADSIVLLPGWEKSQGARLEARVAIETGKDIFTATEYLVGSGTFLVIDDRYRALYELGMGPQPDDEPIDYEPDALFPADSKATNPKDLVGSGKLPLHLWPTTATVYGCLALLDGMLKYGRTNWRAAGVRYSIYHDAFIRHANAAWEGEWIDPDSGLPHLSHALACLAIIVDAHAHGKLVDDRAYSEVNGYRLLVDEMTSEVDRLKEKHAGRDPKHYTIEDVA